MALDIIKKHVIQKTMTLVIYQNKSISFNPKFYYYPSEKTTFWFGLNRTYDDRIGGDMTAIKSGKMEFLCSKKTFQRLSSQSSVSNATGFSKFFHIKNSISFFDRNLTVPDFNFDGSK
jgi:iron complex outermembrane receptor protein